MQWNIAGECVSIIFLSIIWLYSRKSNNLPTLKNVIFQICFLITWCGMISNIITTLCITYYTEVPLWLNWLANTVYFATTPLMTFAYTAYAIVIIYENSKYIYKILAGFSIPAILYLIIVFINPLNGMLFSLDLVTGYSRGPYVVLTYIIFYYYSVICLICVILRKKYVDKQTWRILFAFPVISLVVIFVQQLFPSIILSGTAATCTLLIIYLFLQNKQLLMDQLLHIQNRQAFLLTLSLKLKSRNPRPFYIVVFSLRDFKQINDKFGQQNGDKFLQEISSFLVNVYKPYSVYRFSGDELAIIIEGNDKRKVIEIIDKFHNRINEPWRVQNLSCYISAGIGVVLYPDTVYNMEEIISGIEYAITDAKSNSNENFCFFTRKMLEESKRHNELVTILKEAYEKNSFEVHFQPIWCPDKKKFIIAESLLRLPNTSLGPVYPQEFIPILESTGIIIGITYQVLDKVCKFIRRALDAGIELDGVNVNFPGIQFAQPNLAEKVLAIIKDNNIPYEKIKIEITESTIVDNKEAVEEFIERMHKHHIDVGLDDFGTGYCNMVSLVDTSIDFVKIDKSLLWSAMNNLKSANMMRSIMRVVRDMDMILFCEGIENQAQSDFAEECGCSYIQGFMYARPVPDNEALAIFQINKLT